VAAAAAAVVWEHLLWDLVDFLQEESQN